MSDRIMAEWPSLLPGYPWRPCYWAGRGAPLAQPPELLVVHSGAVGDDIATYMDDPQAKKGTKGAIKCRDGLYRRQVSAHFNATGRAGNFAQGLLLTEEGWHAGGSIWQGEGDVNAKSLSIELPAHQGPGLREAFHALVEQLLDACPSLRWWCRHREIKSNKRDPPPWFTDEWMAGVGLEHRY